MSSDAFLAPGLRHNRALPCHAVGASHPPNSDPLLSLADWGWHEGHELMLPMLTFLPGVIDNGWHAPIVLYNPTYWVAWSASTAMIMGGRLVHSMVGQGDKVRPDESRAEHETRVVWIYANDCTYAVSALVDLKKLFQEIHFLHWYRHVQDGHPEATGTLLGLALLAAILAGNMLFYESIRRRSSLGVQAAIAGNAGFAFAMIVALATAARRKGMKMLKVSWFLRATAVFFAVMAIPAYGKLWSAYDAVPGNACPEIVQILAAVVPFFVVATLMGVAFMLDKHVVWETFG